MEVWHVLIFSLCHFTILYASKEDASYGSPHIDSGHLKQMMKRLGIEKRVDLDKLINELNHKDSEETCRPNRRMINNIIMSSESISNGAKYVTVQEGIPSFTKCAQLCCEDSGCDTALYQENKEQRCYLFVCKGLCKFTTHIGYSVTNVQRSPKSQQEHKEEDELENLHGTSASAENEASQEHGQSREEDAHAQEEPVTSAHTTRAPKPYVAPHTAGLSAFCTSDVSCEDPNAACLRENCECREGYYSKGAFCRKICSPPYFECLKLGSLNRGPECIPKSQVCDSSMQCADGSDELNCRDLAGNMPGRSSNQQYDSRPSSWPVQAGNTNNNNNNNNNNNLGNAQSVQGQQFVQPVNHQQPSHPQTAENPNAPVGGSQIGMGSSSALHENPQLQNMAPSVRPNIMPAQHAASGMGNGNYIGGKAQRPLPNQNTNTNMQPVDYSKLSGNNDMLSANVNPAVNPNPPVNIGNNAFEMKSSRVNPQMSENSAGSPNNFPSQNENNGPFPAHQDSAMGRYPQQTGQRHNRLPQAATSNRAYAEGGSSEGMPINNPISQGQRKTPDSSQKQPTYPQQGPSRTVNRTSGSSDRMESQKSEERKLKASKSHYLSKPSVPSSLPSSSSSISSSSSFHKPQMESQKTNLRQGQQLPSSADKMLVSSHAQAGVKPSQYKSPNSASSSSLSNQPDSTNWLDNDMYMPYGSANKKLPSGRQLPPSQYYGQPPQYYRPYSTDSLNSLPSSLLAGSRSQDDFSQFGGPYLEPQKPPPSQIQYRLNNGNSGYMNYPDSSYNSQFPSPNRYNFGGDFSSTNYQDPDFYLSMGNAPPAYHPDGLYEDNPTDVSNPDSVRKNKDDNHQEAKPDAGNSESEKQVPEKQVPEKQKIAPKEGQEASSKTEAPTPTPRAVTSTPSPTPVNKTSGDSSHSAKANRTNQAKPESPHHSVSEKEHVFMTREKVIIASSSSEAEGPIIALSLGLAFTIILIGLLACRLRNMKHRLRKGRPLNSNEADYLINGMYL